MPLSLLKTLLLWLSSHGPLSTCSVWIIVSITVLNWKLECVLSNCTVILQYQPILGRVCHTPLHLHPTNPGTECHSSHIICVLGYATPMLEVHPPLPAGAHYAAQEHLPVCGGEAQGAESWRGCCSRGWICTFCWIRGLTQVSAAGCLELALVQS